MTNIERLSLPNTDEVARLNCHFPRREVPIGSGSVVSVREYGRGPALVCLHGIGSGAASWLPLADRMGCEARLIAWDAPGYGISTPLAVAAPTIHDYVERLYSLIDVLNLQRCTLIGHSFGALIATAAVSNSTLSKRVASVEQVILISPAGGYGAMPFQAGAVRAKRLEELDSLGISGLAALRSGRLLSDGASALARQWVRWNMSQLNESGYRQAIELLCSEDLCRLLPSTVPLQVWVGALDEVTPPKACEFIARAAHTKLHQIANAGHACFIEQPEAVAGLLRAVLENQNL